MPAKPSKKSPIGDVPPARILCAIRSLAATASTPITADALVRDVGRKLGYARTGRRIRGVIAVQIKVAERRHVISRSGSLLSMDYVSINDYSLADLQDCLLDVATRQAMDREELIVRTARSLGFRRTGGQIEDRLKSAINGLIRQKRLAGDSRHVWRVRASSSGRQ